MEKIVLKRGDNVWERRRKGMRRRRKRRSRRSRRRGKMKRK